MAVYTEVPDDEMAAFVASYGIGDLLSVKGIAEGVENFDQVTYLRERGIAAAQGYVFAPPLPAASFLQLLDAMEPVADPAQAAAEADTVSLPIARVAKPRRAAPVR